MAMAWVTVLWDEMRVEEVGVLRGTWVAWVGCVRWTVGGKWWAWVLVGA
jgi:hypothetical protein